MTDIRKEKSTLEGLEDTFLERIVSFLGVEEMRQFFQVNKTIFEKRATLIQKNPRAIFYFLKIAHIAQNSVPKSVSATLHGIRNIKQLDFSFIPQKKMQYLVPRKVGCLFSCFRCCLSKQTTKEYAVDLHDLALYFPHLEVLNLEQTAIFQENFRYITFLQELRELNISGVEALSLADYEAIAALPKLTSFVARSCSAISKKTIIKLQAAPNLKSLDVSDCAGVGDDELREIQAMRRLTYLNVSNCMQITDEGLVTTAALHNLRSLYLNGFEFIDITTINYFKQLPILEVLEIANSSITTGAIDIIARQHPNLKVLNISETRAGDGGCSSGVWVKNCLKKMARCVH